MAGGLRWAAIQVRARRRLAVDAEALRWAAIQVPARWPPAVRRWQVAMRRWPAAGVAGVEAEAVDAALPTCPKNIVPWWAVCPRM